MEKLISNLCFSYPTIFQHCFFNAVRVPRGSCNSKTFAWQLICFISMLYINLHSTIKSVHACGMQNRFRVAIAFICTLHKHTEVWRT